MSEASDLSFCIPIEPPAQGGGGFRFLANFERYLDRHRIPWTRRPTAGAKIIFLNAWHVGWRSVAAAALACPSVTVVHRVDGAAADYGRDPVADRAQSRVNRLADLTIFQSEYCRYSTRLKFPIIGHDGPVIHNPVDLQLFRPDGKGVTLPVHEGPRVCAVTWSTNPRKGAPSLYRLALALPHVQFVLCGRFEGAPAAPNIVMTGVLEAPEVAAVMRSCDALATFSENEACPNVVLEALASGLPVLYLDSGATRELVGGCGAPVTEASFAAALRETIGRRDEIRARARARALERFDPELVFARYLEQIRSAMRIGGGRAGRLATIARQLVAPS